MYPSNLSQRSACSEPLWLVETRDGSKLYFLTVIACYTVHNKGVVGMGELWVDFILGCHLYGGTVSCTPSIQA